MLHRPDKSSQPASSACPCVFKDLSCMHPGTPWQADVLLNCLHVRSMLRSITPCDRAMHRRLQRFRNVPPRARAGRRVRRSRSQHGKTWRGGRRAELPGARRWAALALPKHDSSDPCGAAAGAAAGQGVTSADPRDPGSGAEPGGALAGGVQRALRRASSARHEAASDMFTGASAAARDDAATAHLIKRHAARLAELNRRGAGDGGAGGRECLATNNRLLCICICRALCAHGGPMYVAVRECASCYTASHLLLLCWSEHALSRGKSRSGQNLRNACAEDLAKGSVPVLQRSAVHEDVPCQDGVAMDTAALQQSSGLCDVFARRFSTFCRVSWDAPGRVPRAWRNAALQTHRGRQRSCAEPQLCGPCKATHVQLFPEVARDTTCKLVNTSWVPGMRTQSEMHSQSRVLDAMYIKACMPLSSASTAFAAKTYLLKITSQEAPAHPLLAAPL